MPSPTPVAVPVIHPLQRQATPVAAARTVVVPVNTADDKPIVIAPVPPMGPEGPPGDDGKDGVGVVVSATEPPNPEVGTIWVTP